MLGPMGEIDLWHLPLLETGVSEVNENLYE